MLLVWEVPGRLSARLPGVFGLRVRSAVRSSLADAEEPGRAGLSSERSLDSSLENSLEMSTDEATEFRGVRSPPPSAPVRSVAEVPMVPIVARLAAVPGREAAVPGRKLNPASVSEATEWLEDKVDPAGVMVKARSRTIRSAAAAAPPFLVGAIDEARILESTIMPTRSSITRFSAKSAVAFLRALLAKRASY